MSSADIGKSFNLYLQAFGSHKDPKQLELVQRIIDRTKGGKISWQRSPSDFTATVANRLSINFVYGYSLPPYTTWKLFTVRDEHGNELIKVENRSGFNSFAEAVNAAAVGREAQAPTPDPVLEAVNQLYLIVEQEAKGDIDKAIAIVEQA